MKLPLFISMISTVLACNNPQSGIDPDTDTDKDTDVTKTGFPSAFLEGKFRITSLQLNELGDGLDLNGDGTPDNNLPNALGLVDLALYPVNGFLTLMGPGILPGLVEFNPAIGGIAQIAHGADFEVVSR